MTRGVCIAAICLALSACTHTHLPRNAPGRVQLDVPPEDLADPAPELPEDPGERMLLLSYGVFGGGGIVFEGDAEAFDFSVGPELSLEYGDRETSHFEDDFLVLPARSLGLRLGLNVLERSLEPPGAAFGELAYTEALIRLGAGWAWDAQDARHGPQVTLSAGPIYLRGMHLLDYGTSVQLGLLVYASHAWLWSR